MKKNLALLVSMLAALIVSSCASNTATEQKIEKEISEVPVQKTKTISENIKEQINASGLTVEQKDKLMKLQEKSHTEYKAITEEIEKTKVVLIQTVLAPKMSDREFSILKNKIKALDKKRMDNGFKTASEVRKIISPEAKTEEREIYKAVLENHLRGF